MANLVVPKKGSAGEPLVSSPSSQNIRQAQLLAVSVDDIEDTFKRGYIDADQYHAVLRERAHAEMDKAISDKGFFGAALAESVKNLQAGWDTVLESAKQTSKAEDKPGVGGVWERTKPAGMALWGAVQVLTGILSAGQKVAGHQAERWALNAGASPGLARLINISVDVGSGFVPVGKATQLGVKATQGVMKIGAKEVAAEAGKAKAVESVVEDAVRKSLTVEGVEETGKTRMIFTAEAPEIQPLVKEFESANKAAQSGYLSKSPEGHYEITDKGIKFLEEKSPGFTESVNKIQDIGKAISGAETAIPKMTPTVAEQFVSDFNKFRREMAAVTEPQSHAETARLAKRLGLGLDDLRNIVPGKALDEKEMFAYLKALEPQAEEAIRLAKVVKAGGTEADANAFAAHMSEFLTLAPIFRGAEVTAGRSVEILKETPPMKKITDMLLGWDPESIARGDFQRAMKTMADDVLIAADTPEKLVSTAVQSQSLWGQFKENVWPKLREGYYNLLLPLSLPANAIGNAIALGTTAFEHTVGGMFSADKAKGLVASEGWMMLKGYTTAFGDGMKAFGHSFTGVAPGEMSKLDYMPHQLKTLAELPWTVQGAFGQAVNLPADTLRGMDNFNRALLRRGSYYGEAIRDGLHAGMSDDAAVIATKAYREQFGNESLTDFVKRRVQYPTNPMIESADALATHHTYQDQLGTIAEKLRGIAQVGPMSLYFPFMKTPINLVKYAWDRTPGLQLISGQLYKDIAAGGVKADEAIARITIANMQGMFIYQMAQEGYLTGSGPVDPTLRRVWLATHQPYSVKTKDGWMPITNFEPGNTPIGLVADFAQIHNQLDEPSAAQSGMAITFSLMRGMLDKTWWRTLSDLTDVASSFKEGVSPNARLRDIILSPAMTVATGGPLVGAIKRGLDPVQRETRTLVDSFMSRTPGYSQDVPAVRDAYGDPVLPPQHIAGPWLGLAVPLKEKKITPDRVEQEGDKLQIKVPQFPWVIGGRHQDDFDIRSKFPEDSTGIELTPKQRDRAQILYRDYLRNSETGIENGLMATGEYKDATRAGKREMFMDALATYRKMATETLMVEDIEIGQKLIQSQSNKLLPFLKPREQDQLKTDTTDAMDTFSKMAPEMRENLLRWGSPPGED